MGVALLLLHGLAEASRTEQVTFHAFFMKKFNTHRCTKCDYSLYDHVYTYSLKYFGFGLCKNCQKWLNEPDSRITIHSKRFYLALRCREVNVVLEQFDGHKHIDIAIKGDDLKLNLEIDGSQHYTDVAQSFADLLRTYNSLLKGYYTLRLPNILVAEKLDETADVVVDLLTFMRDKYQKEKAKKRKI